MPDDETRLAQVFRALADPTRRRLLDRLHADNGQPLTALCCDLGITRQGITQHLDVLVTAGLVSTVRRGREKLHYLNPVPLHDIHQRWIARFEVPELDALSRLKKGLELPMTATQSTESATATKPGLVYVTYIAATQDSVWQALTDPEQTASYWDHRNVSGWQVGDSWQHVRMDGGVDVDGRIVAIDPPRKLVHVWASPGHLDDPEHTSTVTFELQAMQDCEMVRLTMTHENLPDREVKATTEGWAIVLSSMKSFLETGTPLPLWAKVAR